MLAGLIVLAMGSIYLVFRLETEKPSIDLQLSTGAIGASHVLPIKLSDRKSGIRKVWVGLVKGSTEVELFRKDFTDSSQGEAEKIHDTTIMVKIETKSMGITDGMAVLRVMVRDRSWQRWFHGNLNYLEKSVSIDTKPPGLKVLTRSHNVSQGGGGLIIYRLSEPCRHSGISVGDHLFPGYNGYFSDQKIYMAFFALNHQQGRETKLFAFAVDQAGNRVEKGFPHYLKKRQFKKETIKISDKFLNQKMPEFETLVSIDPNAPYSEMFVQVNNELRRENIKILSGLGDKTATSMQWKGTFLRLPRSARRSGYGEYRRYKYNNEMIDRQTHLGIDLASVKQSRVPAANHGKVIFTGPLGIYGNTIVIDHGFALMSTYSHLSRIDVEEGQTVKKGDIIGLTGKTGLVGGDHLHFGIMIHDTFVNPIEWWDANWIKNNITGKIREVKAAWR